MIGELVGGRYRVLRSIASGGMGAVYEASHEVTGRHVALKIIRVRADSPEDKDVWLARFAREARAVGGLSSANIAQVFDASADATTGQPFIAMELLTGSDLGEVIRRSAPLAPEVALKLIGQACRGLERAHAAGIVHRDIKPGNLFLAANGDEPIVVKMLDFGVAKFDEDTHPDASGKELTKTGAIVGTPTYMSPEQAMGLKQIDGRSDLWSLGVVLFRALTATTPHPKLEGTGQLIVAICTEPAPSVQSIAPWVPPAIAAIVRRALKIDKELRYQSAGEMLADIRAIVGDSFEVRQSELTRVSDAEKTKVQPRHSDRPTVVDSRPGVPNSARTGPAPSDESATQPGLIRASERPRPARTGRNVVVALALVLPLVAGGAWIAVGREKPAPVAEPRASENPVVAASAPVSSAPAPSAPRATERRAVVTITPSTAIVTVDGRKVALDDGKLVLVGAPGSVHEIVATEGKRELRSSVVISETGAVPDKLALPATGTLRTTAPRTTGKTPAADPVEAPRPPPPADTAKKESGLKPTDRFE